jgi:plasmid stability protein
MANIQYTIRGISERLDARIRERAAKEGKSLNEALIEVLKTGLGIGDHQVRYTDLDDLAGTWVNDPEFDRAIEEMDRVDPELWK